MTMADRYGLIWLDGAMVHLLTHTLHYGMVVFEGIRADETGRGTAIFWLAETSDGCSARPGSRDPDALRPRHLDRGMPARGSGQRLEERPPPAHGLRAWYWGPYLGDKIAMLDEVILSQLPHQSLIYLDGDGEGNRAKVTEVLAPVCSSLQHAHKRGRSPLIVVGAGVSRPAPARVPLMDDLLGHIIGLARSEDPDDEVVKLCAQANKTHNRSDVAILFGALQHSRTDITRRIWKRFCDDFLSWKIQCSLQTTSDCSSLPRTPKPEPTEAHRWIAEMCVSYGARCLSVNFDGLTRGAVDLHLEDARMPGKTVILDTAQKIENFFGRAPMRQNCKPLYAVFKIRGDVFYARCKTSGCPLECDDTPVYDLDSYIESTDEVRPNDVSVLACPECAQPRNLQIGFPGHHEKTSSGKSVGKLRVG